MTVQESKKEMEICNELMLYDFSYGEKIPYESLNESNKKLYDAHVIAIESMEEVEQYRAIAEVIKDFDNAERETLALALEELKQYRVLGTVEELKEAREFKKYFDDLYGEGLEVANWHKNGDLEPFDSFYESALDWGEEDD